MKLSAVVRALVAAKATPEMILAAVEAAEAGSDDALEKRRQNDRDRKARQRESHVKSREAADMSRDFTGGHSDRQPSSPRMPDPAHVEDNLQTRELTGKQENKQTSHGSDLSDFKAELNDLGADRLEAVIKHRRSKRGQLTGHAARLFRQDAEACGLSIADAVDTCISRNWITVKPEFLARSARSPPSQAPPRNAGELARMQLNGTAPHASSRNDTGRLDTSDGRRQADGTGIARRFAVPAKQFGGI